MRWTTLRTEVQILIIAVAVPTISTLFCFALVLFPFPTIQVAQISTFVWIVIGVLWVIYKGAKSYAQAEEDDARYKKPPYFH
jgi:hypothetical protein